MNKQIIIGRLTADPELRTTQNGVATATISVAVDRRFAKQGEERKADFFSVVFWRQQAEFVAKYFRKGSSIAVEGEMQCRNYEKDGHKYYVWELIADRAEFVGNKNTNTATGSVAKSEAATTNFSAPAESIEVELNDNDDLPF